MTILWSFSFISFVKFHGKKYGSTTWPCSYNGVCYKGTALLIDLSCIGLIKCYQFIMFLRFYPALKTLEQLEHTYLPRVSNHWFSQTMAEAIPQLRNRIKDASMTDLKDFLENIRKHSAKIGEVAMRHVSDFSTLVLLNIFMYYTPPYGVQWFSGRVLDSRLRGSGFEPHRRDCVVFLEQDTFILA